MLFYGITDPMIQAEYGGKYLKERLENIRFAKQQYPTADFANISDLDALVIAHNAGETTLINYPDKLPDITKSIFSMFTGLLLVSKFVSLFKNGKNRLSASLRQAVFIFKVF